MIPIFSYHRGFGLAAVGGVGAGGMDGLNGFKSEMEDAKGGFIIMRRLLVAKMYVFSAFFPPITTR